MLRLFHNSSFDSHDHVEYSVLNAQKLVQAGVIAILPMKLDLYKGKVIRAASHGEKVLGTVQPQ
jgi:hypothetical protein